LETKTRFLARMLPPTQLAHTTQHSREEKLWRQRRRAPSAPSCTAPVPASLPAVNSAPRRLLEKKAGTAHLAPARRVGEPSAHALPAVLGAVSPWPPTELRVCRRETVEPLSMFFDGTRFYTPARAVHAVCVARHAAIHMHPQRKGSTAGWPTWFPPMSIPTDAMFARLSDRLVAPPLVGLHAHKHEASLPLCTNLSSPSLSPQQSKQHGRCGVTPCDTVRRPSCSLHRCLRSIGTHIPELWG
jgi:hypothetical protein